MRKTILGAAIAAVVGRIANSPGPKGVNKGFFQVGGRRQ